ncbi:TetR family transcriptional regulator [Cellulomonas sp. ACRRI]|uniref:TetR/AcrR family transcriptional regulator n=1 Tax=Cellulomonas sp. ACRRI TaxID=2918188 RepID=UPI001EF1B328|nr:TetR/AcrR family transcriptional regulator [Cellulomonas sp. ACRRI]MCG7284450.1 TetR family transcriptional regulator [Cellulomonas sp. ACRRI]
MPDAPTPAPRTFRADAQRNRDRILEVAEQHFAEHGVSASLDQIAKGAQVGPGTLYRHFPTREALLAELLEARESRLGEQLAAIRAETADSGSALHLWLDALGEWAAAFDGLPEPLREAVAQKASPLALTCEGYITTTETFLLAAQRDGSARAEVRARDLFLLVLATSWVRRAKMADDASRTGLLDLVRTGWCAPDSAARSAPRRPVMR